MLLYHGTDQVSANNIKLRGIDFSKCDEYTDNGQGFYLSESYEFAAIRAKVMTEPKGIKPVVIEMHFDEENADKKVKILKFDNVSDDWKFFVAYNRLNLQYYEFMMTFFPNRFHNRNLKYDIVIDIPADSRISDKTDDIDKEFENLITKTLTQTECKKRVNDLISSITIGDEQARARQFSFHTKQSLKFLQFERIMDANKTYYRKED